MPGWGGCQKPKKSQAELDVIRRQELGQKYFTDIEELQAIVAKTKVKIKRLRPAPRPDDVITDPAPSVMGPCQKWRENHRQWRSGAVVPDEPRPRRADHGGRHRWKKKAEK
jgi:hypothetical protein